MTGGPLRVAHTAASMMKSPQLWSVYFGLGRGPDTDPDADPEYATPARQQSYACFA